MHQGKRVAKRKKQAPSCPCLFSPASCNSCEYKQALVSILQHTMDVLENLPHHKVKK